MKKILWGALFLIPSLLLPLVPALAQLDPTDGPNLQGPLKTDKARCYDILEKDEGTARDPKDQTVMARVRLCSWLVSYDHNEETDAVNDYGAAWSQTSIDMRNGYCVRQANTKIRLPYGEGTVLGRTPHQSLTISAPQRKNVALALNPPGDGEEGTVSQHFRLYPDELRVIFKRVDKGRLYVTRWNGKATDDQTLSFAAGVAMSWNAVDGSPKFLPRLNYRFIVPNDNTPRVCG
ncbi:MAG: hypothetical protein QOH26_839 [Actinomycetota bacterium]|nr:hypothetical protein [Actinomycetota bacterium]